MVRHYWYLLAFFVVKLAVTIAFRHQPSATTIIEFAMFATVIAVE